MSLKKGLVKLWYFPTVKQLFRRMKHLSVNVYNLFCLRVHIEHLGMTTQVALVSGWELRYWASEAGGRLIPWTHNRDATGSRWFRKFPFRRGIDFPLAIYTTLLTPLDKYLLSPYFVPATMLEVRDTSLRKTDPGGGRTWSLLLRLMTLWSNGY